MNRREKRQPNSEMLKIVKLNNSIPILCSIATVIFIVLALLFQFVNAETPNDFYISGLPNDNGYTKTIRDITFKNGKSTEIKENNIAFEVKRKSPNATTLLSKTVKIGDKIALGDIVEPARQYQITASGIWNEKDEGGNVKEVPFTKTYTFTYDTAAPVIKITGVKHGEIYKNNVKITADVKDDFGLEAEKTKLTLKKEDEKEQDILKPATKNEGFVVSEDGKYRLDYYTEDKAGNVNSGYMNFTIDKTAPKISLSSDDSKGYIRNIGDLKATMDDASPEEISIHATNGTKSLENKSEGSSVTFAESEGNYDTEEENWTVTVVAKDKAGNETKKVFTVIKDTVSPEVSFSGVNDAMYYNYNISITQSAKDKGLKDKNMKISLVPAGENKSEEIKENVLSKEGKYTVTGTAEDYAGNKTEKKISFVIDKTAPEVNYEGLKKNAHYQSPGELTIKANEPGSLNVAAERDGETFFSDNTPDKKTLKNWEKDGDYTITTIATDLAGNASEKTVFKFVKDSTKPKLDIRGVKEGSYYNKTQTVQFTALERYFKTNKVRVLITKELKGNESEIPYEFTSDSEKTTRYFNAKDEGKYNIKFTATDEAGNEANPQEISFTIDKTPPKTKMTNVKKNFHYKNAPKLHIEANEPGTVYAVIKRDGKKVKSIKGKNDIDTSAFGKDGDYVVTAYSVDLAKNKGKETKISFVKDSTAPKILLSGAGEGKYYNQAKGITIAVTERYYKTNKVTISGYRELRGKKTSIGKRFNGKGIHAKDMFRASENGTYHLEVSAKDEAGNVAKKKTLTFTVDTKKPVVKISIPKKENGYNDSVTPSVHVDDDYMKDKSIILTKTSGSGTGTVNMPHSDKFNGTGGKRTYSDFEKLKKNDGAYTLKVSVSDKAGNSTTKTENFVVDRFGSLFKIKNVPKEFYMKALGENIEIEELNVSKVTSYKVEIRQDGDLLSDVDVKTNKQGNHTFYSIDKGNFSEDGIYTVNLVTKDRAGNTSESKKAKNGKIKFAIDNASPIINYSGVESEQLVRSKIARLNVSATDTVSNASVHVTVNGEDTPVKDGEVVLHEGYNQTVVITATDKAGNVATKKLTSISVSDSPFARFIANKWLLAGSIACIILIAGGITLVVQKKKKKASENEGKDEFVL